MQNLRKRGEQRWPLQTFLLSEHDMIHHGYLPLLKPHEQELLPKLLSGRLRLGATCLAGPWWAPCLGAIWSSRYESIEALCHACTCSMRTLPIFRFFGRLRGCLCFDGWMGCRPEQQIRAIPRASLARLLVVSAVPCPEADIAPKRVLGGLSQLVTLPSRDDFDEWMRRGREDAAGAADAIAAAGLVRRSP